MLKSDDSRRTVNYHQLIKGFWKPIDISWVKKLLDEGRIEQAVERAKKCLARVTKEPGLHSYTNVFKAFQ